jgi:nicotinate-nucleotide adenylyltransferase
MRIGLLGGTFNPVHNAHLEMAQEARSALQLDQVFLVVANIPPHKDVQDNIPACERLHMVQLACASMEPEIQGCNWEITRIGKSYTVDTLAYCHERYPEAEIFYIVGTDMLLDLPHWYNTTRLFELATFVCVPRAQYTGKESAAAELLRSMGARIILLPKCVADISSTQIRSRVRDARSIEGLVPPAVERYIYNKGIYFPFSFRWMQEKCHAALNEYKYQHTMGVVRTAVHLAERCGVDGKKARLAALLHDCGKNIEPDDLRHAQKSAELAQSFYGVNDPDILRAIKLHTTGGADMTMLDKLIYLADLIEPNRHFPGVEELREIAARDVDEAFYAAVVHTIQYVQSAGLTVHPDSYLALNDHI